MEGLTVEQLTTVAGIATATALLSELIWRTTASAAATVSRFGPVVAVGLGIVLATGAGILLGQGHLDIAQDGINGVVGGLAAMGIHDLATSKAGVTE